MTIHNIYLAAACLIWLAVLLVLYIRIVIAGFRRFLRRWAKARIASAFSPKCTRRRSGRISRRFYRYARDEQLFQYLCQCYCREIEKVPQDSRPCLARAMMEILDSRISMFRDEDPIQRRLLMQYISSTRLSSEKIDRFVEESACTPFQSPALTRLKAAR